MTVIRHADTWVELYQLGKRQPYRPTYSESLTLGPTHRRLLEAPLHSNSVAIDIGVMGSLRREDAAKLYELAFFVPGNVLELGCGRGLSTTIIAEAVRDANRSAQIVSVDVEARMIDQARAALAARGILEGVEFVEGDASAVCRSLAKQGLTFGLVFVDHSHAYDDVRSICVLLPNLVQTGGFVLFHDFNDRRNNDLKNGDYGVYAGVIDGLPRPPFSFYGVYGCVGLYRREMSVREKGDGPQTQDHGKRKKDARKT